MTISLENVRRNTVVDRQEGLPGNTATGRQGVGSVRAHVLGLPQHHESFVISLRHDSTIALKVSLEDATIRMIDDRIVIDFARIRGGRIILDLTEAGPEVIFTAKITSYCGVPMSAFEAFFHALSTELDFPVSDVAWALAQAVQLDMDSSRAAEAAAYRRLAAE
ncbi:MAG: hypothetical protein IPK59_22295 [Rhodospirillaceae bacterium]|nr:hypothetical protein [Rhodospirillaceae bacterium]